MKLHSKTRGKWAVLVVVWAAISCMGVSLGVTGKPWKRHTIDASSRGADGVRLADVNGDHHPDVVTGWEEGGVIRVYLNPGPLKDRVTRPWPSVTVGQVKSPEDAVFVDLDRDGAVDVVSSCEGSTQCMFVHWAPWDPKSYLDEQAWTTEAIPATRGVTRWMFALPMQMDGQGGVDIVVASKGEEGLVGWLQSPADPRKLENWKLHKLCKAGWIMSVAASDIDDDGDTDLVLSDRRREGAGVFWLDNPGPKQAEREWSKHYIGARHLQVMFLDVADVDGNGRPDILTAVKRNEIHWFRGPDEPRGLWPSRVIKVEPAERMGTAKGIRAGDIDGDGQCDVVYSCEHASPPKRGVVWLGQDKGPDDGKWTAYDISGPDGVKYDLVQLQDLDGDGDLDVLTCEERQNLGVFWYENPSLPRTRP